MKYKNYSRVLRGGSWLNGPIYQRVSYRYGKVPDVRYSIIGFRLVLTKEV